MSEDRSTILYGGSVPSRSYLAQLHNNCVWWLISSVCLQFCDTNAFTTFAKFKLCFFAFFLRYVFEMQRQLSCLFRWKIIFSRIDFILFLVHGLMNFILFKFAYVVLINFILCYELVVAVRPLCYMYMFWCGIVYYKISTYVNSNIYKLP